MMIIILMGKNSSNVETEGENAITPTIVNNLLVLAADLIFFIYQDHCSVIVIETIVLYASVL